MFRRSLGCLKLVSNLFLSIFDHCSCGPASLPDYHENELTWEDSSLVVPLEFKTSLNVFWPLLMQSCLPPSWLQENRLIWVDLTPVVPFGLSLATAHAVKPPHLTITRTIWSDLIWLHLDNLPWLCSNTPLSSPWAFIMTDLACFKWCINCIFCAIVSLILSLFKYSYYCMSDPGNVQVFRSWNLLITTT